MNVYQTSAMLDQLYEIYDRFAKQLHVACVPKCAQCCTRNVTVTSLEALKIVQYLNEQYPNQWIDTLKQALSQPRFKPQLTTNRLVQLCIQDQAAPEEDTKGWDGECPFLTDGLCPIYPIRPFGCRCFVSRHPCPSTGYAEPDAFTVTVNTVFLQYIEHIDQAGHSGNLIDMLWHFASQDRIDAYIGSGSLEAPEPTLIQNLPIPALMIPPEHRQRIQPILKAIHAISISAK